MAAIAILVGAGFASCSKDDNEMDDVANSKKITQLKVAQMTYSFSYNTEGNLTKIIQIYDNPEYETECFTTEYNFLWDTDSIKVDIVNTDHYDTSTVPITYYLSNGLIYYCQGIKRSENYTYNDQGYLSHRLKVFGLNYTNTNISWDGNKVVSASDDNKNYTFDYDKKVKTCKGYIPSMFLDDIKNWSDHEILFVAHPELAGLRTNKLPKGYKSNYGNEVFSYEFDASGYISKIIVRDSNQSTFSYNLTWE